MNYLLQLGNTPSLSVQEAKSVIGSSVEKIDDFAASFSSDSNDKAIALFEKLGASVRLVKVTQEERALDGKTIEEFLAEYLIGIGQDKFKLAVAQWGEQQNSRIDFFQLKKLLSDRNIKVRFVEGSRHGTSAAVLLHQKIEEFVVLQKANKVTIGETIAIQNIDHWTLKDRGKPYADRKKGMLPPKVARTMINLATNGHYDGLLYDPFCGTGTVLIEGLEMGMDVIRSDSDPEAILGSQTNLAWFKDREKLEKTFSVFQSDVSHADKDRFSKPVDYLVTEPFLGKPKPDSKQLPDMFRGLEKLYIGAFNQWRKILHDGSKIVIVFPRVEMDRKVFDLSGLIDKLSTQGYTLLVNFGDLRYHRETAVIQRDILIFEYRGK